MKLIFNMCLNKCDMELLAHVPASHTIKTINNEDRLPDPMGRDEYIATLPPLMQMMYYRASIVYDHDEEKISYKDLGLWDENLHPYFVRELDENVHVFYFSHPDDLNRFKEHFFDKKLERPE